MASFFSWVQSNWSNAVGAAGIIGGLWFTAASFRQETKAKETANILTLNQQHRDLWSRAQERQELVVQSHDIGYQAGVGMGRRDKL